MIPLDSYMFTHKKQIKHKSHGQKEKREGEMRLFFLKVGHKRPEVKNVTTLCLFLLIPVLLSGGKRTEKRVEKH